VNAPDPAVERPFRYERVWDALARGPRRASPYRRPPDGAGTGLHRLRELRAAQLAIDEAIAQQVAVLAALGTDWGTVGRALGVSRQAARQRYGAKPEQ
jgi:hypothetical protein